MSYSIEIDDFLRLVQHLGFGQVYREAFIGRNDADEHFFVFFHPDGVLLTFDTYGGENINGGNFYYNVAIDKRRKHPSDAFSSGHYPEQYIFAGNHDCRNGISNNIDALRKVGKFLNPWKYDPGVVWLVHYADGDELGKNWRHEAYSRMAAKKTIERAARLSHEAQDCIAVSIKKCEEELRSLQDCLPGCDTQPGASG